MEFLIFSFLFYQNINKKLEPLPFYWVYFIITEMKKEIKKNTIFTNFIDTIEVFYVKTTENQNSTIFAVIWNTLHFSLKKIFPVLYMKLRYLVGSCLPKRYRLNLFRNTITLLLLCILESKRVFIKLNLGVLRWISLFTHSFWTTVLLLHISITLNTSECSLLRCGGALYTIEYSNSNCFQLKSHSLNNIQHLNEKLFYYNSFQELFGLHPNELCGLTSKWFAKILQWPCTWIWPLFYSWNNYLLFSSTKNICHSTKGDFST